MHSYRNIGETQPGVDKRLETKVLRLELYERLIRAGLYSLRENMTLPRGSTIEEGGDTTISSPGRSPKQAFPGIELQDPLHGRQASPEFIAFDQGVGQICPQ